MILKSLTVSGFKNGKIHLFGFYEQDACRVSPNIRQEYLIRSTDFCDRLYFCRNKAANHDDVLD